MPRIARSTLLERFRAKIAAGRPLIGGGAGTGLSAKCEEAGGIDLIVIYNSGRYRMAGRGSLAGVLAYGNANDIVCEMAHEVLPVVKHTPVLAGVNGTDPFMIPDEFLRRLISLGFSGVQNFPTVGLIDGTFRANLEETGMGYGLEVEMIRRARDLDLLTTPYVFSAAETKAMTEAGADIIVCHMGLTTGGAIGAETALKLSDCVAPINEWAALARSINPEVIVLCHGGPIATPDDAAYILKHCPGIQGFYGASSMERLPTEVALTETTRRFVALDRADAPATRPSTGPSKLAPRRESSPLAVECLLDGLPISIDEALRQREDARAGGRSAPVFLCTECQLPVHPHKEGTQGAAHFEHARRNPVCSLSDPERS